MEGGGHSSVHGPKDQSTLTEIDGDDKTKCINFLLFSSVLSATTYCHRFTTLQKCLFWTHTIIVHVIYLAGTIHVEDTLSRPQRRSTIMLLAKLNIDSFVTPDYRSKIHDEFRATPEIAVIMLND